MGIFTGVDVSQYQGILNWDELAQSVSFVIYRGGGAQGGLHVDTEFLDNHAQARAHNIPHGIYWFGGGQDPESEARYFYQQCLTNLIPGEVIILDAEWNLATNPAWCLTFMQTLEGLVGFKPMIYMNHALMMSQDWSALSGANYGLWLADWDGDPNIVVSMHDWTFCAIQQYKDNGSIGGIGGSVDVDAFFASSMSVWNQYGKPQPQTTPIPVTTPDPTPPPVETPPPVTTPVIIQPTQPTTPVVVNDPLLPTPVVTPVTTTSPPSSTSSTVPTSNPSTPVVVTIEGEAYAWYEKYAKGVVAFITTGLASLATWSVLVPPQAQHWFQLVIGLLGSLGVVITRNKGVQE